MLKYGRLPQKQSLTFDNDRSENLYFELSIAYFEYGLNVNAMVTSFDPRDILIAPFSLSAANMRQKAKETLIG